MTDAERLAAIRQAVKELPSVNFRRDGWAAHCVLLLEALDAEVAARQQAEQELVRIQKLAKVLRMEDAIHSAESNSPTITRLEWFEAIATLRIEKAAVEQERDRTLADCHRLLGMKLGGACEHHRWTLDELSRHAGTYGACPICWQKAAEAAEQQVTALTERLEACQGEIGDLQSSVNELAQESTALRAALDHYGAHDDDCDCYVREGGDTEGCTCGLDAALAGSRAPTEEPTPHD